ncbi:D-Ala-D-Ala carboxypeptidase family metallohydrolase [Shinella sumterensis]|uniref:D-Ala-D-Ala carboxypeptidase family metallohydrolase n=1 Tax=Shinella sumterensis TaxID=1967501 RepID=UPI003F86146D
MQGKWPGLKTLRYGLLLAVSVATLSGCVSAVSTDLRAGNATARTKDDAVAAGGDETTTPVVAETASAEASADAAATGQQTEKAEMAGLVMQPASLDANKASIYSNGGQVTPSGAAYAAERTGTNPATTSLYSTGAAETTGADGRLPVEDMPQVGASVQPAADGEQALVLPETGPIPKTARTALVAETQNANPAELAIAAQDGENTLGATVGSVPETQTGQRKQVTLASLFANKREAAKDDFNGERFATRERRVLNRDTAGSTQKASLGTLPGVSTANAMFSTNHSESDEVEDDAPQFKEVASLAGLARLAPNGLWLQTEKVKTGCFKPELLQVLKNIEHHYDKPIIVTSGLRDVKVNRAKQSLHTRCEAADIQIAGVSKWELAEYLRSMPGRGGVGTYCHTESVHIDIGPERDWNWRCRRK